MGYRIQHDSRPRSRKLVVIVPVLQDRVLELVAISTALHGNYNRLGNGSSVGRVEINGFTIYVKPEGGKPDYRINEECLVKMVNNRIAEIGAPVKVCFHTHNSCFSPGRISHAMFLGKNHPRFDVGFVKDDGSMGYVSVKMPNFSFWSYLSGAHAREVNSRLESTALSGRVELDSHEGRWKIGRSGGKKAVWTRLTPEERQKAVFGDGDQRTSAVVICNFIAAEPLFCRDEMHFRVSRILRTASEAVGEIEPIAVARNESRSYGIRPGIRFEIQAARKLSHSYEESEPV